MGISLSDLSPAAQRQAAAKLAAAEVEKRKRVGTRIAAPAWPDTSGEKGSKYHSQKAERGALRFDSKKEARRFDELMLLLQTGKIRNLKLQQQFTLQEAYTTPDGKRVRAMRYVADFMYERIPGPGEILPATTNPWIQGLTVVEDVKSSATKTHVYEIKKKLLRERLMIEIAEV